MGSTVDSDEAEGLFSKRSSSNILSDPRILQHLRIVAREAHQESLAGVPENEETDLENQQRDLYDKITAYNKRNQLGAFKILARENLNYEGALRFYFLDGGKELTKAVKLNSRTTVKELLPSLVEKFRPGLEAELVGFSKLYAVQEQDEICLDQTEWPLVIALNATKPIRFILRINKDEKLATDVPNEANPATNGKLNADVLLRPDGGRIEKRDRPLSGGVYDFMYAGRDKSIKMTAGAVYDKKAQNSPKPKKNQAHRTKGRSLGAVLKLPKKNRTLERGSELSTNHMVPGVLKVFGSGISQDSNYKSVKATTNSDADSIVRQALGKYKLDSADPEEFVLCDVVGYFRKVSTEKETQMRWVTEYARVVGEKEHPLVLQSLWQPSGNRSRRFELHRKASAVDAVDGAGAGSANNGIARKKATIVSQPPDIALLRKQPSISTTSEGSESGAFDSPQRSRVDDGSISHSNLTFNVSTAIEVPYLLLIRGSGIAEDYLLHRLDEETMVIGRPTIGKKHPDIPLYSDDLQTQHCQIFKKFPADNESVAESEEGVLENVFIEPFPNCEVLVNGMTITEAILLTPGDLLQIGSHYVFLYKDPLRIIDSNLILDWLPGAAGNGHHASAHGKAQVIQMQQVARNPKRLSLSYELEDEDKLLEYLVTICEPAHEDDFELVASYLFILAIEFSAFNHTDVDTRRLILKVTNLIQGVAWEKTKGITETNVEGEIDPLKSLNEIIPDLKQILFWMSNALEMLHFLQDNLSTYLPGTFHVNSASNDPEEEALANADEELLNVLEEVAMFTFQQTVYHLTKVLYVALPLILDTNPFQKLEDDEGRDGDELEGAEIVVQIFQTVYDLITSFHVHHQIVRQLFAYLFFFTNASLFNTLMDRGAGGKFYRWAKGAQIRGNLDLLEGWALDVGLQEEAADYLRKLSSAADVLATPKVQLLQATWQSLRHDFPVLNAAQLHKILTEYQVGAGKSRPAEWRPIPDEVDSALKDEEILESFSTHPPFLFPTSDYLLDLESDSPHPVVKETLDNLKASFGSGKDPQLLTSTPRQPQVLIQAPDSDGTSRHSTPLSSAKSSPPTSLTASPKKLVNTFSSSDPTLNNVDPNRLSNRLKNHVNGISKSASWGDIAHPSRTSKKARRSRDAGQKPEFEVQSNQSEGALDEEYYRRGSDAQDDVFVVELNKGDTGIGVGLIDGLYTPLKSNGIYVRTLVATGPAAKDGRLKLGDRILAVNGTSLVGADYQSAMKLIRNAGNHLTFLVAKSDQSVAMKITASTC
ncbi:ras-associating and dilute domain-containing protein-like [Dendronephthya gigantea]|uniref:ras-associating and dilute domain-containing protein-like n=1 Tax=Dendronephthya gigantea TaxID=151771 RepID=UPI00106C13A2|nr:ras-associating and dilute domain-containing protein-like [Dendronephthya gigantea]